LFLIIRAEHNANDSNKLVLPNESNAIKKEIFEIKSIDGINIAGKTSKLDNIYINLLLFSQESIF
tara:strand:+ start:571 stop:765 length:195 start_codon:yes stop_codon:yes gene_type:complete